MSCVLLPRSWYSLEFRLTVLLSVMAKIWGMAMACSWWASRGKHSAVQRLHIHGCGRARLSLPTQYWGLCVLVDTCLVSGGELRTRSLRITISHTQPLIKLQKNPCYFVTKSAHNYRHTHTHTHQPENKWVNHKSVNSKKDKCLNYFQHQLPKI